MGKITRAARRSDDLLARILDLPHIERVVPQLPVTILQRVVETCGLEDCGELVSLTTPEQLSAMLDLDLWRSRPPGLDERFDAARFGVWLEVLAESGAAFAAQRLAAIDPQVTIAALAQYIRVFDPAALLLSEADGEVIGTNPREGLHCEMGGYIVAATVPDYWDTIVAVLVALEAEHADCFHRLMAACRTLSHSTPEEDGFHNLLSASDQMRFDVALNREGRRERQGYVTPAQSRAFLQSSRALRLDRLGPPPLNPLVAASLRAARSVTDASDQQTLGDDSEFDPVSGESASAVAAVFDMLTDAGVVPDVPRALLTAADNEGRDVDHFTRYMQYARDLDPAVSLLRTEELAFLANVLVAGCSLQERAFTTREAFDGAVAVCNLGLENWPPQWRRPEEGDAGPALPADFLVHTDLTIVFQVGWAILHRDVCLFATQQLIDTLDQVRSRDRDVQIGLLRLRRALTRYLQAGTPWHARDAFDVIAVLDMPVWAALLGLIAECPVMLANVSAPPTSPPRTVSPSEFIFISENRRIASVRAFIRSVPAALNS